MDIKRRRRPLNPPRCLAGWIAACITMLWGGPLASVTPAQSARDAYVASKHVRARCGPGDEYYATDPLRHGQRLKVFHETADGWLGIQPVADSFDWLPADSLRLQPGGQTAEVIEDGTPVWIGTQLGRARRYRWQVRLQAGETVTILDQSQRAGPDGPQTWFRIVPPSGEFRWVHRSRVVGRSEELLERLTETPRHATELATAATNTLEGDLGPSVLAATDVSSRSDTGDGNSDRADGNLDRAGEKSAAGEMPHVAEASTASQQDKTSGVKSLLSILNVPKIRNPFRRPANADAPAPDAGWQSADVARVRRGSSEFETRADFETRASSSPIGSQWFSDEAIGSGVRPASFEGDSNFDSRRDTFNDWKMRSGDSAPTGMLSGFPPIPATNLTPITSLTSPEAAESRGGDPGSIAGNSSSGSAAATEALAASPSTIPISAAALDALRSRAEAADSQGCNLLLSELMARAATSVETRVLVDSLDVKLSRTVDPGERSQLSALRSRAQTYARLASSREVTPPQIVTQRMMTPRMVTPRTATIREGDTLPTAANALPAISSTAISPTAIPTPAIPTPAIPTPQEPAVAAPSTVTHSGQLVPVYSSRPGSPPFALSDGAGRTICYVAPLPGMNLRRHLHSTVEVQGTQDFLRGMSIPVIEATQVFRR